MSEVPGQDYRKNSWEAHSKSTCSFSSLWNYCKGHLIRPLYFTCSCRPTLRSGGCVPILQVRNGGCVSWHILPRAHSQRVEYQSLHLLGPTYSQDFTLQTPRRANRFRIAKGGFLGTGVFLNLPGWFKQAAKFATQGPMPPSLTVMLVYDPRLVGPRFPREKLRVSAKKRKKAGWVRQLKAETGKMAALWGLKWGQELGARREAWSLGRSPRARNPEPGEAGAVPWAGWTSCAITWCFLPKTGETVGGAKSSRSSGSWSPNDGNKGLCTAAWLAEEGVSDWDARYPRSASVPLHISQASGNLAPGSWPGRDASFVEWKFSAPCSTIIENIRRWPQSFRPSTGPFWAQQPRPLHGALAQEAGPAFELALDTRPDQWIAATSGWSK